MLYAVLGAVLGQEQMLKVNLVAVVAVVAVTNALLVLPANRVLRWAFGPPATGARHATGTAGARLVTAAR